MGEKSIRKDLQDCPQAEKGRLGSGLHDAGQFLRLWASRPKTVGAISPSGKSLARKMASEVPLSGSAPVIELGPGTGSVTRALLDQGVEANRLFLIEFNQDFCELLSARFPKVTVIQGDAYNLEDTLSATGIGNVDAIVSSLPLFTRPRKDRLHLFDGAFRLLKSGKPFIQFSYAHIAPLRSCDLGGQFQIQVSPWILLNIPPARVWRYVQLA